MRLLLLSLLLCIPAPVAAESKTVQIPLRYRSALEVEALLSGPAVPSKYSVKDSDSRTGRGTVVVLFRDVITPGPHSLPAGISAWTADPTNQSLWVTGTEAAVQQVEKIVRLLDIPTRRVRLHARAVEIDAAQAEALFGGDKGLKDGEFVARSLSGDDLRRTLLLPARVDTRVPTANNHPLKLRLPRRGVGESIHVELLPRLNGDGTLTLITTAVTPPGDGKQLDEARVLRRIESGTALAIQASPEIAWVFTYEGEEPNQQKPRQGG